MRRVLPVESTAARPVEDGYRTASFDCSWTGKIPIRPSTGGTFLDQPRCREPRDQGHNSDISAPRLHFAGSHHVRGIVVAPLHQDIRLRSNDQLQRRGLIENNDGVDSSKCSQYAGALVLAYDGAGRSLQSTHRGIAVDGNDKLVAEASRLLQQRDVADVEQVETAIREDDAFPAGSPHRYALDEFLAGEYTLLSVECDLRAKGRHQLMPLHGHRAHLAHDNAGSDVGQLDRRFGLQARSHAKRH